MVRIWISMIRAPGGWGQASTTAAATSGGLGQGGGRHARLGPARPDRELGLDPARADRADLDAVRAELLVERLGHSDLGELGRAVDRLAREAVLPGHGRDHEDG